MAPWRNRCFPIPFAAAAGNDRLHVTVNANGQLTAYADNYRFDGK
jgi:hypothetical protein